MPAFLHRLRGHAAPLPPAPPLRAILLAGLGGFLAIAVVAGLAERTAAALVLGSFGASCVLVFGFPEVPFSQPRNVVLGHVLSSAVGLACLSLAGPHWWAAALAVALAIMGMMALRCVHPPAGSNPVIVFLLQPGWSFLLLPTLAGALLLVGVALVYNNLARDADWPRYW
ncbi:MAG TPA: HPP family protein [Zoogloea sp.]|uniref:HPP family protein n=1 Tax=Zoogloea sp. TaxID=49181 RepID=UPI002C4F39DF|nr:HPP family protein [Zoogloea sp.]HMV18150.1 HPP family protein [Rhodocyclaceae bacterium]HMV63699.1 HPP family protein [Rhodocyclaceae bacterium]HMY50340.1 HPP family protein [Rhodocyclaceae bacterium]HMZ75881.1 HPP family protein [Rhodocyclaceae bacterium]HNA67729.1 HPP family protein [Rhodocyclaceae bacterium]